MKNKSIMTIALIAIIVAAGFGGYTLGNQNDAKNTNTSVTTEQQSTATDHNSMSMMDMNKQLEGLSGDDYDKAFIEMMITHHEGAVDMAELSASRAKHDEIKQLSQAIITAQDKEIADMKQWQRDWGYSTGEMNDMMHGGH
ncbi:DUF305 domain-containing protein [Candidatus Saccharibacteria bacterium]|jgi:uncharacterized protein (DUF305 family)|nr:DUF305 domain-containing protein [Candidatus Saccharibacteria bacterium]